VAQVIDTDPILYMFTSGSTGVAEGRDHSAPRHPRLRRMARETFAFSEDTVSQTSPPFISTIRRWTFIRCAIPARAHTHSGGFIPFPPSQLMEFLRDNHVDTIFLSPP
jgi:acyl-coenzyme A synthetase/AMP-(fatty) acid ligase